MLVRFKSIIKTPHKTYRGTMELDQEEALPFISSEKAEALAPTYPVQEPAPTYTDDQLKDLSIAELRQICKLRGVSLGKRDRKVDILEKLLGAD